MRKRPAWHSVLMCWPVCIGSIAVLQSHSKIIPVQVVSANVLLPFQACFQKSGASVVAIRKYIIHKYPSLELERRGYLLKQALKRELERGIIRQVRVALWSSTGGGVTELHTGFLNSGSRSFLPHED